jgi:riboflavin biosynthesis pyrimidine reductase
MTKVQVISIVTIDGYLAEKDYGQSAWIQNDRNGLRFWQKLADYILPEDTSFSSLIHEKEIAKTSYTYLAEALSERQLSLIRGLFTYKLVDEIILYVLPSIAGKGIHLYASAFPVSNWTLKKSRTFSNGVCRLIYCKTV